MVHPKYTGPVIDAHCHYDATTRARAADVNEIGGLSAAIHLWDAEWPPASSVATTTAWSALEPALYRCHVPDLSAVGAAGSESRLEQELRDAAAAGVVGVKVWKNLGLWLRDADGHRLAVNDPRLGVLWATAAELGLPIAIHQGDPPAFFAPMNDANPRIEELRAHPDWWYGGGDFPSLEQIHEELESVIADHAETRFIAVHFGCFMSWAEVARMFDTYPNYHTDTAAAIADMGRGESAAATRQIIMDNPKRVIFGTDLIRTQGFDMPDLADRRWELAEFFDRHWRFFETADPILEHPLPAQGEWTVRGLDLPADGLPDLYEGNARSIFRLPDGAANS